MEESMEYKKGTRDAVFVPGFPLHLHPAAAPCPAKPAASEPSLTMVSFTLLCAAIAASVTSVAASPLEMLKQHEARGIQPGTGNHNGFFYSFWKDNQGSVDYNNGARGSYNVRWSNVNNWVGGKGWKPGPPRVVKYNGTWNNYNINSCMFFPCSSSWRHC